MKLKYEDLEYKYHQLEKEYDVCKREKNLVVKKFEAISKTVDERNNKAAQEIKEIKEECMKLYSLTKGMYNSFYNNVTGWL